MSNFGTRNSGFFNGGTNGGGGGGIIILGAGSCSSVRCGSNNTATCDFSTASGGYNNTSSGYASTISGGYSNSASGCFSNVSGGYSNSASGCFSNVSGGYGNSASGQGASVQGGSNASAYLFGMRANANVNLGTSGDNQNSILFANKNPSLTSGGTSILYLDGTVATITPSGSNRSWNVFVQWNATVTSISGTATGVSLGDVKTRNDMFFYKKVGGVGSVSSITQTGVANDTSMNTSDLTYANNAGSLQVTFVAPTFLGGGTVTFKVGATLKLTEIAW